MARRLSGNGNGQKKSEGNYKPGNAGFTVSTPSIRKVNLPTWHENGQIKSEEIT